MNEKDFLELWENKEFYAKGKRGIIYKAKIRTKKQTEETTETKLETKQTKEKIYLIKTKNPCSEALGAIKNEYEFNVILNKKGIGPKIYFYDETKDFLVREFVEGQTFFEWTQTLNKDENRAQKIKNVILKTLDQCRAMDSLRVNKTEMTNPHKDLLITQIEKEKKEEKKTKNENTIQRETQNTTYEPVLIDFERCKYTHKPKNVTQFCQFLIRTKTRETIPELQKIKKETIIALAEKYKEQETQKNYEKIKEYIQQEIKK